VLELLGDGPTIVFVSDAVLLTSELVTNAALHTKGPGALRASFTKGVLRVEVSDGSPDVPTITARGSTSVGGHGLRLIDAVAYRWGADREVGGKTVWFELVV
jgi:anti-sigma regulatory factor (Ser/Thr protein kinase)